jgi:23S rRNA (cytosine1962-C5)-methyltransferase
VDRYGDVAVIHVESWSLLDEWLPQLKEELAWSGSAYAKVHPRSASHLNTEERRRLAPDEPLWGQPVESVSVAEFGTRYLVRPTAGLSVGLFLDMREVRSWLRQVSGGRTVLNLFAYTCSLGVCAALGSARRVVNIDVSRPYLEWGKANYELNGCSVDARDFIYGDAFDWLRRFARRGERFDLVIVDPPSFSSTPFSVTRDYARLAEAAVRVVSSGGVLLAATNHAATTDERFDAWLRAGLTSAGRPGEIVKRWHEPEEDFPLAAGQRPYLKVRAVRLD